MRKGKPSMKKEKKIIGVRKAKKGEDTKGLGRITFGKTRPDKTKYVLVDIEYDEKAGDDLYECGMVALKHDREAVIEYVVKKALKEYADFGRKKK
jgi:hypothetical protein